MATIGEALQVALEHHRSGRLREAETLYLQILNTRPDHPESLHLLGVIAHQMGQHAVAVEYINKAIAIDPTLAEGHNNIGEAYRALGEPDRAIAHYRQALALRPGYPQPHNNLGIALSAQGRYEEAIVHYRQALTLDPAFPEACNNLGAACQEIGRLEDAVAHYRRAIALKPAYAEAHRNLGNALREQGKTQAAAAAYRQAQAVQPNDGVKIKLATLLPVIMGEQKEVEASRATFEKNLAVLENERLVVADPVREVGQTNFYLSHQGYDDRDVLVRVARLYERACPALLHTAPHCTSRSLRKKTDKIRIGFISRFFRNHSVAKAGRGVLAGLSRDKFIVTALFVPPVSDDETAAFVRQHADHVVVLPGVLDAARERIAAEKLDILFYQDLGMDPFTYFLAFARLAPVQCVFFGHAETSGIRNVDYFISSESMEPAKAQAHYSERLIKLKTPCSYYYKPETPAAFKPRRAFGLDDAEHIYLCPQMLFKFHPAFDDILAGILEADPLGRLVLKGGSEPHWTELLMDRFKRTMGPLVDRVTVLPPQPGGDFINLIAVSDVMLDTIHFGGYTTSLEAFAVGTPVVTWPGRFQRGRHTLALYKDMGIRACVAKNPADYIKIAVRLGTDKAYRNKIKTQILAKHRCLYEHPGVVREYERAFLKMVNEAR